MTCQKKIQHLFYTELYTQTIKREEFDLLQQHDKNQFGEKFREHHISSVKPKKQAIELFSDMS